MAGPGRDGSPGQGEGEQLYDIFGARYVTDPVQTMTRAEIYAAGGYVTATRYRGDVMLLLLECCNGQLWLGDDSEADEYALCRRLVHDESAWAEFVNGLNLDRSDNGKQ